MRNTSSHSRPSVAEYLRDGEWHTLHEIRAATSQVGATYDTIFPEIRRLQAEDVVETTQPWGPLPFAVRLKPAATGGAA